VAAGAWHGMALSEDGGVYTWGHNASGQVNNEPGVHLRLRFAEAKGSPTLLSLPRNNSRTTPYLFLLTHSGPRLLFSIFCHQP